MAHLLTILLVSLGFDFAGLAGYSSLGYGTEVGIPLLARAESNYSLGAHLGMSVFFGEYVGLSLGGDITRYGGGLGLNGDLRWDGVVDTDGEDYCHVLTINSWRERQFATYVAPQLMLLGQIPAGAVRVSLGVGAEYGFLVGASYKASGLLTHTGYYAPWDLTLKDMPAHGFFTSDALRPSGRLEPLSHAGQLSRGQQLALVAKTGVLIPVAEHWDITLHAVAKYTILTGSGVGGEQSIGFQEDPDAHYFIPQYAPLIRTYVACGTMKPWTVGLEVGARYTLSAYKRSGHKKCNCRNDVFVPWQDRNMW